jgi:predicted permease
MLEAFWQDLRHGIRILAKNPGFAIIAIVSIAIGVGANVGMFSVADALLLRPLPVARPGDVVTISATSPGIGFRSPRLSYLDYVDLREQSRSFDGLVAFRFVVTSFAERRDEPAQRKFGLAVSGNLFEVMGVRPALGRAFRPDEDEVAGRDAVVILDHREWTQQFGADPGIVGRSIRLGGAAFTVIGVAPAAFTGIDGAVYPAFYIPLAAFSSVQSGVPPDERTRRDLRVLIVKGRLKPGITLAQANADVDRIASNLQQSYPGTNRNQGFAVRTEFEARLRGNELDALLLAMLMMLAVVVLIVACANVAGLLMSRAPVRTREVALRLAIGAGRGRLLRQLVTESLILAASGGALGLVVGYGVIAAFQRLELPTDVPLKLTFALDRRVFLFGLLVSAASAILSSLVPAWLAARTDLVSSLKDPAATASQRTRLWGRSTLVCGQVALSCVLLTISVSLYREVQVELLDGPGYRTDHLLMMRFDTELAYYDDARTPEFYRILKDRAAAMPGVRSVALTSSVPMKTDTLEGHRIAPEGFEFPAGTENVSVLSARIDDDYFATMDIPVVRGRGFGPTDTMDGPRVVIVNETFAARYWPAQDAIGKRVRLDEQDRVFAEVVGVAADAKYVWVAEAPTEFIYLPRTQVSTPESTLLIRSDSDAAALAGPLREVVRAIDPNMPVFGVRTMEDFYYSRAVHTTNLIVGSVSGMGSMGLILSMVGLYGLVAYTARRRTREIGIRMAVGADPKAVLTMVVRHGLVLLAGGIVVGLIGSAAAGRLMRAAFPIASGIDVATHLAVICLLTGVTIMAVYFPARRAARVDPVAALRAE